ncbi:hypothetical protein AA0229_2707 [Gluconobacter cerinus NRIC 0229]|nr:hypothetical protein AA0229_2707 [Gluconobacter cerinus NRIC 0229]
MVERVASGVAGRLRERRLSWLGNRAQRGLTKNQKKLKSDQEHDPAECNGANAIETVSADNENKPRKKYKKVQETRRCRSARAVCCEQEGFERKAPDSNNFRCKKPECDWHRLRCTCWADIKLQKGAACQKGQGKQNCPDPTGGKSHLNGQAVKLCCRAITPKACHFRVYSCLNQGGWLGDPCGNLAGYPIIPGTCGANERSHYKRSNMPESQS